MSDQVLPCPFCGTAWALKTVVDANVGVAYTPLYRAGCHECDFWLPGAREYDEAVAQWNRRDRTKDSERLDWLSEGENVDRIVTVDPDDNPSPGMRFECWRYGEPCPQHATLREAIDAARAAEFGQLSGSRPDQRYAGYPQHKESLMSWSVQYLSKDDLNFDRRAVGSAKDEDLSEEAREQVEMASECAVSIIAGGQCGGPDKDFFISIAGHANPKHQPTPGLANDCITVTVTQKSAL